MICGRDYQSNGPANGGCGQQFQWSTAPKYVPKDGEACKRILKAAADMKALAETSEAFKRVYHVQRSMPICLVDVTFNGPRATGGTMRCLALEPELRALAESRQEGRPARAMLCLFEQ